MACPKWSLFVAGFSIVCYSLSVLYMFGGLVGLYNLPKLIDEDTHKNIDPDSEDGKELEHMNHTEIAAYTVFLVADLSTLFASIFLLIGLKKKIHQSLFLWLVVSMTDVLGGTMVLFFVNESKLETGMYLLVTLSITVFWYPIYKEYKRLRFPEQSASSGSPMARICHQTTEYVHHTKQPATAPIDV
ncbi:uncharacterized protein LOC106090971 isoform X2 [Stomoxys calcitrans]|uniref:uncharacterized protein LOC106090971 isoform X2 n=1 Tax=Stomoxys calcitrans TaxID=35570 RepID=UPI0027E2F23D|nr:uncharacterized protein LOC106090971 isoform X2 [Stomoxys calcitrans]